METVKKEIKLKNKYNGVIVHTKTYDEVTRMNNIDFIRVFDPENPHRSYLANREAFDIITK